MGDRSRVSSTVGRDDLRLSVRLQRYKDILVDDEYTVVAGEVDRRIRLVDPGIDDQRNDLLWGPESSTLIQAQVERRDGQGRVLDRVSSYTAMRAVSVDQDKFMLNGFPQKMRLVLVRATGRRADHAARREPASRCAPAKAMIQRRAQA